MPASRRRSHERRVHPDFRLDRVALSRHFAACLVADRTNMHALSAHLGVPVKQLQHIANRRRVMDWAYHAAAMWCAHVEAQVLRRARDARRAEKRALLSEAKRAEAERTEA